MLPFVLLVATALASATSHNHTRRQVEYSNFALAKANTRINTLNSIIEATKNGERPIRDHLIPPQFWKTSAEVSHPAEQEDFILQNVDNERSAASRDADKVGTMQIIDDMGINPLDPLNLIDTVVPVSSMDEDSIQPQTVFFIRRPIALEEVESPDEIVGDFAREADASEEIGHPDSGILVHSHGGAIIVPDNPRLGIAQKGDEEIVIYTQSDEIDPEDIYDDAYTNKTNIRNSAVVKVSDTAVNNTAKASDQNVTIHSESELNTFSTKGNGTAESYSTGNLVNNTDNGVILENGQQNETVSEVNPDITVGQSQREVEENTNSTEATTSTTLEKNSEKVSEDQHSSSRSAIEDMFEHRPFSFGREGLHIPHSMPSIPVIQAGEIFPHSGLHSSPHMLPTHSDFFERFAHPDTGIENGAIPSILNHHHRLPEQLPLFRRNEDPATRDFAFTDSIISPIFRSLSENLPRSAESDLRNADADPRHHLHSHTFIHHHGPLRPFVQPGVLPQLALHINQNQHANVPAVQPTYTLPVQHQELNNNIVPSIVRPYGGSSIPTSSGQVANVNGNSNSVSQNQQSSVGGLGNAGHLQAADIHGDVNAVAQHQSVTVARESESNSTGVSEETPKKVQKRSAEVEEMNVDAMERTAQPTLHNVFGNRGFQQGVNSAVPQQFFTPQSGIAVVQPNRLQTATIVHVPQAPIVPLQQAGFIQNTGNMPLSGNIVPSFFRRSNDEVHHVIVNIGHNQFHESNLRNAEEVNSEALAQNVSQTELHHEKPLREREVVPHGSTNLPDIQHVVIPQTKIIDPPDVFPEEQFISANLRPRPLSPDNNESTNTTEGSNEEKFPGVTNQTLVVPSSAGCSCSIINKKNSSIEENSNSTSENQGDDLRERTVVPHSDINFSKIKHVVTPQTEMIDPPDVFPHEHFIPANLRPRPTFSVSNSSSNTSHDTNEEKNPGVVHSSVGCSCSNTTGQDTSIEGSSTSQIQGNTTVSNVDSRDDLNNGNGSTVDQQQQFFRKGDSLINTGQVPGTQENNPGNTSLYEETTPSDNGGTQTTEATIEQSARANNFLDSESGQSRLGYMIDVPNWQNSRQSQNQEMNHFINKRSLAVTDLFRDPNKKIDVPKTVENIGTITKDSFQNQDAPMYHLNNVVGSIKNVVMSTMKIPPQDLVIPTQYKIVNTADLDNMVESPALQKKSEFTRSINTKMMQEEAESVGQEVPVNDPFNVVDTFHKVGAAVRDSIRSGQDTLTHVGDIAHSARKVVQTARLQAPRVVLPAVLGRSGQTRLNPDRVTLIAPKILDIKDEREADDRLMQAQTRRNFVGMGEIMDAIGVSNPEEDQVKMQKVVINRKPLPRPSKEKVGASNSHSRLSQVEMKKYPVLKPRIQEDRLQKTASEPKNKNLKEFVTQMRNELDSLVKDKMDEQKRSKVLMMGGTDEDKGVTVGDNVLGRVRNRLDRLKNVNEGLKTKVQAVKEKVGDAIEPVRELETNINLPRPKNFQDVGKPTEKLKGANADTDYWDEQVESFLTDMFSNPKGETKDNDNEVVGSVLNSNAETVGRVYIFEKDLLTPFMGRASKKDIKSFLKLNKKKKPKKVERYYGEDDEEDEDVVGSPLEQDDMAQKNKMEQVQKVLGSVNPLMFEKMFNETLRNNNMSSVTPYALFKNNDKSVKECEKEDKVGTSMTMTREMLKPFMGSKIDKGEMFEIFPVRPDENQEENNYNESY